LIIFTEDSTYGAFLFSAKDVILFTVDTFKNVVKPRSVKVGLHYGDYHSKLVPFEEQK
jgi:hypothetical protein